MKAIVSLFIAVFVFAGCGLLEMPSKMDKTNENVELTVVEMRKMLAEMKSLHKDEQIGGAVSIFKDDTEEFIRIRSLLIFFEKGELTEVIWQYLGAPRPIYSDKVGAIDRYRVVTDAGLELFDLKNVSYVGEKSVRHDITSEGALVYRKVIKPVSENFHLFLSLAVEDAIEQVLIFDKSADTQEKLDLNKERAFRVVNVATTVYGGITLESDGRSVGTDKLHEAQEQLLLSKAERVWMANQLRKLMETVDLSSDLPLLASLVESRMGLDPSEWDSPEL